LVRHCQTSMTYPHKAGSPGSPDCSPGGRGASNPASSTAMQRGIFLPTRPWLQHEVCYRCLRRRCGEVVQVDEEPAAHPIRLVLTRESPGMTQAQTAARMTELARRGPDSQGYVSTAAEGRLPVPRPRRAR